MALTATPVPGNTILAAWGGEIRNRTIQVFASLTEANTWAAPEGALCFVNAPRRFYFRYGTAWRPVQPGGPFNGTCDALGDLYVAHGLGIQPVSATVTPGGGNPNFQIAQIMDISVTNIRVRCRNAGGTVLASQAVSLHWQAIPAL